MVFRSFWLSLHLGILKTKKDMIRKLFSVALLMGTILLTGCLSNESDNNQSQEYVVTKGAYVVNAGDSTNGNKGSLMYIDFSTNTINNNVYPVGSNPTDVLVYGNKVYVVSCDDNAIFVLNKNNNSLIEKISTTEEMGDDAGVEPRYATAYGSNVYVSTHGGYVAVIDTVTTTLVNKFKVGSYPEGLGVGVTESNSTKEASLYVANSDNGNGNGSISKINLGTGSVTEIKNDKIQNPQSVVVAGSTVFYLDYGKIDNDGNQKENGVYVISDNTVTKIIDGATGMSASGTSIVTYNYPKGSSEVKYSVYNLYYGTLSTFYLSGDSSKPITNPKFISVDPNSGYLTIGNPGYVNMYDGNGNFYKSYEAGSNPSNICYSYGVEVYKY